LLVLDKDLIESFCLEIISNSIKITKDIKKISTHEFSSESSKEVLIVIRDIAEAINIATQTLFKQSDWEDNILYESRIRQLRRLKELIQIFSSHLQFIENSKMDKIPWSLIEPLQKIASSITPNAKIVLCQQWDYNYSIYTRNLFEQYHELILILEEFIPEDIFNSLIKKLETPLYLVNFPYLEKNNILLFSLLGHEIGHLVADKLIQKLEPDILGNTFRSELRDLYQKKFKGLTTQPNYLAYCSNAWKRLFEELLSDIIGSLIFGPAMLFSMFEFSIQYDLDMIPDNSNQFYPPWRARLRIILNTISEVMPSFNNFESTIFTDLNVKNRLLQIKTIIDNKKDIQLLKDESNILISIIYENVIERINSYLPNLLKKFNKDNFDETKFFDNINSLNSRLQKGIPPNIIDELDLTTVSSIEEIINSAWKYRLSWESKIFDAEGNFNKEFIETRKNLNKLTIKAIEYMNLSNNYKEYISQGLK
jgi:hypothetical protein